MMISNKNLKFALIAILLLSLVLNICGIGWGLPSWKGWAPDEVTPQVVLNGIEQGFSQGWHYKYPPVHFYILAILYSPILLLNHFHLLDIHSLSTYTLLFYIGRFTSVIMGTATVFFVYLCGQEIYSKQAALFAALITAAICPYIYHAKITNLDIPYLFWFLLSLIFYMRMLKYQKMQDYLGYAIMGTVAICTKDQAYGLYLLTPFLTFFLGKYLSPKIADSGSVASAIHFPAATLPTTAAVETGPQSLPDFSASQISDNFSAAILPEAATVEVVPQLPTHNTPADIQNKPNTPTQFLKSFDTLFEPRKITLSLMVAFTLFFLLQNIAFNLDGFIEHIKDTTSGGASINPRFQENILGHLQMFWQTLIHIRFSMGWPMFFICIAGIITTFTKNHKNYLLYFLLIPMVSYYLTYITIILYNAVRYLLPCYITLAFFGGQFIVDFLNAKTPDNLTKLLASTRHQLFPAFFGFNAKKVLVIAACLYTLAYSFSVNVLMMQDSRYYVETWMQQNISNKAVVLGAGDPKYLPRLEGFNAKTDKEPSIERVASQKPDYIITTNAYDIRRFKPKHSEYKFFDKLNQNQLGYELIFQYHATPKWNLFNPAELDYVNLEQRYIYSNINTINPEISIFSRVSH